jgi:hypothetical protein
LRPPAEGWVQPADRKGLERAVEILGTAARVLPPIPEGVDLSQPDDLVEAVIGVISRHPMQQEELVRALERWSRGDVCKVLGQLGASGRAQVVTSHGRRFWSAAAAHYAGGSRRREKAVKRCK